MWLSQGYLQQAKKPRHHMLAGFGMFLTCFLLSCWLDAFSKPFYGALVMAALYASYLVTLSIIRSKRAVRGFATVLKGFGIITIVLSIIGGIWAAYDLSVWSDPWNWSIPFVIGGGGTFAAVLAFFGPSWTLSSSLNADETA